ncbi:hypothetical protein LP316_11460 [Thalassotalea sp. LPB0316]|uniref:hypothetical protein n=1 Tax=Thalassotalea sp. LPB0316 TaxID=2769490 RepID=UPI0018685CA1|nr:hypothetical protein [Thalassotalea sp. LPB0316]QOL24922.1 hypothetical protein LP316_11460 [Thalassotalea sp. LPB0316]
MRNSSNLVTDANVNVCFGRVSDPLLGQNLSANVIGYGGFGSFNNWNNPYGYGGFNSWNDPFGFNTLKDAGFWYCQPNFSDRDRAQKWCDDRFGKGNTTAKYICFSEEKSPMCDKYIDDLTYLEIFIAASNAVDPNFELISECLERKETELLHCLNSEVPSRANGVYIDCMGGFPSNDIVLQAPPRSDLKPSGEAKEASKAAMCFLNDKIFKIEESKACWIKHSPAEQCH